MLEGSIDRDFFNVPEPSPWKPWLIASVAALAILGTAVGLMAAVGLFDIPEDDPGAKSFAAALVLVGAILSAAVTLVGTVVKYSIDDRNARMSAVEASRNYALALGVEKRNRIEVSIRAINLFSENNKDATESQISGAMFALINLGELDIAVALLSQLWPSGMVSNYVADAVLAKALDKGSEETQIAASSVLWENADLIEVIDGTYNWPIIGAGWKTELHLEARRGLVGAATKWIKSVLLKDKDQTIPVGAVVLCKALNDTDSEVREIAASCLRALVQFFPDLKGIYMNHATYNVAGIAELLTQFPDLQITTSDEMFNSEFQKLLERSASNRASTDSP